MSERFEDRFRAALLEAAPHIEQETGSVSSREADRTHWRLAALAVAGITVALIATAMWPRGSDAVVITPATQPATSPDWYLGFPGTGPVFRDRTPQLSPSEQERFESITQRFAEPTQDRNRARLTVGEIPRDLSTISGASLVSPAGRTLTVMMWSEARSDTPQNAYWELGGRRWSILNGDWDGDQRLADSEELLAFIDSLRLDGDRLASSSTAFVEDPPRRRRLLWAVETDAGARLEAWSVPSDGIADLPGKEARVRGTTGVVTQDAEHVSLSLSWVEHDMVLTLRNLPSTVGTPSTTAELTALADDLHPLTAAEFDRLPWRPAAYWGTDGDLAVRVPPSAFDAHGHYTVNVLQYDASGQLIDHPQSLGTDRISQEHMPDTIAIRTVPATREVVVWAGAGSQPPSCATHIPSPAPPSTPAIIDLDPTCGR